MFCPRCKAGYRPGFIRCADCDIELVDHLPEEHNHLKDSQNTGPMTDFVIIMTARDPVDAGQICSFLQANGIPARSAREALRRVYGMGTGPEDILVPGELADTALDLLERVDSGEFGIDASET